ncbi:MAG: regulatory signaling modulator protein AmpE [Pseudomonadales bacterium]|nr:regulatory signaling modulator protein AmpE [Pseudomonadales bacterium]
MSFLAILISLAMLYKLGSISRFQPDQWFYQWLELYHVNEPLTLLHALIAVLLPSFLLALIYSLFAGWFWGLAELVISLAVILFSLGRGDFKAVLRQYADACQQQTVKADDAKQSLIALSDITLSDVSLAAPASTSAVMSTKQQFASLHLQIREQQFYCSLQRIFAVIFWFAVLGPIAVFAYRLLVLYLRYYQQMADQADQPLSKSAAYQLLHLFEWPVARLQGLCYAVVGELKQTFSLWLSVCLNPFLSSSRITALLGASALNLQAQWNSDRYLDGRSEDELYKKAADEVRQMLALYDRALMVAVILLALYVIL